MGALSWLNAETVERASTLLFARLVRCSAHGPFFARLRYVCVHVCVHVHMCVCVCVCGMGVRRQNWRARIALYKMEVKDDGRW